MAPPSVRKSPASLLEGRALAMAVIAVVAGGCFALGFLVGRATSRAGEAEIVAISEAVEAESQKEEAKKAEAAAPAADLAVKDEIRAQEAPAKADPPDAKEAAAPKPAPAKSVKAAAPAAETQAAPQKKPEALYTVQIGAFKNARDAEAFEKKFSDKGYDAYTVRTKTKDQKTMYKVRVGRFAQRKEADLLSVKLKKTEGVSPFVVGP